MPKDRPRHDADAPVRTYRVPTTPERVVHYPGMAQEAMRRITAALAGQLPVAALIAWCDEAEDRWPLVGWKEAGETLRRLPARAPTVPTLAEHTRQAKYEKVLARERAMLTPEQRETRARLLGANGQPEDGYVPF